MPKSYKIGKDVFDIPDSESEAFLKDNPEATEINTFTMGKDTFDIPINEVADFLKENPGATALKKKDSGSNGGSPAPNTSELSDSGIPSTGNANNPFNTGIPKPQKEIAVSNGKLPPVSMVMDEPAAQVETRRALQDNVREIAAQAKDYQRVKTGVKVTQDNARKKIDALKPAVDKVFADIDFQKQVLEDPNASPEAKAQAQNIGTQIAEQNKELLDQFNGQVDQFNKTVRAESRLQTARAMQEKMRQADLEKEYSLVEAGIEKSFKYGGLAMSGLASAWNDNIVPVLNTILPNPDAFSNSGMDREKFRETLQDANKLLNEIERQEIPKNFEHIFQGEWSPKKLGYVFVNAVSQAAPTVAAGLVSGGTGSVAAGTGLLYQDSKDMFQQAGLNDDESGWAALGLAIPMGLLERAGMADVIKAIGGRGAAQQLAKELVTAEGKALTKEQLFEAGQRTVMERAKTFMTALGKTAGKESLTEMEQAVLQEGSKQLAEASTGQDSNAGQTMGQYIAQTGEDILEQGVYGLAGGTGFGALGAGAEAQRFTQTGYEKAVELKDTRLMEEFQAQLQQDVKKGALTAQQAQEATANVQAIHELDNAIPRTITDPEARTQAVNLLAQKAIVTQELEGKDEALSGPLKAQLDEINKGLEAIANPAGQVSGKSGELKPGTTETADNKPAGEQKEGAAQPAADTEITQPENQEDANRANSPQLKQDAENQGSEPGAQLLPEEQKVVDVAKAGQVPESVMGKAIHAAITSGDPAQVKEAIATVKSQHQDDAEGTLKTYGKEIVDAIVPPAAPQENVPLINEGNKSQHPDNVKEIATEKAETPAAPVKKKAKKEAGKPETFRETHARFEAETVRDHIADFFAGGGKVRTSSFNSFGDPNAIKGTIAGVLYMRKEGLPIDVLAADIARMPAFEGHSDQDIVEEIVSFIRENPDGYRQYVKNRVQEQSQDISEQADEYYARMYGEPTPEMLEGMEEDQQGELLDESEQFDNWLNSLSPEETDKLYSEFEAATNPELIDNLITQSNGYGTKEAGAEKSNVGTKRTKKEKPAEGKGQQENLSEDAEKIKFARSNPFTTFQRQYPDVSREEYFSLRDSGALDASEVKRTLPKSLEQIKEVLAPKKESDTRNISQQSLPVKQVIQAAFKLSNKAQDKFAEIITKPIENWASQKVQQWNINQNSIKRNIGQFMTAWANGMPRTDADLKAFLKMKGGTAFAKEEMARNISNLRKLIDNDLTSLARVHEAMDPDFYSENPSLFPDDFKPATFEELNDSEKNLYEILRKINDYVHDYNFAMGFINEQTYNKNLGKYIPRMYEPFEVPEDVERAMEEGANFVPNKLKLDFFKAREEVDEFKKNNILKDPIYATAKRLMQTEVNAAISGYIEHLVTNPDLVSSEAKPGFTQMVGKGYGKLDGKFVPNYIAQDFKGYFFANKLADLLYDVNKLYDRNQIRQFYKKYHTVFSPTVQVGNLSSNFVFAFLSGIDPVTMASNFPKAYKELKEKGSVYEQLAKNGILGSDVATGDLLPLTKQTKEAMQNTDKAKGMLQVLGKVDEKVTKLYKGTDDISKTAAFLSLKEYGYTDEQSMQRVYEGFQNYATVGKIWDFASKTPVIGNAFIKFKADLMRILKNAATQRPLSTASFLLLLYAAAEAMSNMSGEDDDEKELRESRPFIPKIQLPGKDIPLVFMTPAGEVNVARYLSPYYNYDLGNREEPIESYSKMLPYQVQVYEKAEKGNKSRTFAIQDPFLGPLVSVFADRDFRGKSIQDPEATRYRSSGATAQEKTLNQLNYIMRSQFPYWSNAQDMYLAMQYGEDFYGRERNGWQSIVNNIIKIENFSPAKYREVAEKGYLSLDYQIQSYEKELKEIAKTASKAEQDAKDNLDNKFITQEQYDAKIALINENYYKRVAEKTAQIQKRQREFNEFIAQYRKFLPNR